MITFYLDGKQYFWNLHNSGDWFDHNYIQVPACISNNLNYLCKKEIAEINEVEAKRKATIEAQLKASKDALRKASKEAKLIAKKTTEYQNKRKAEK